MVSIQVTNVYALDPADTTTPPAPPLYGTDRLERAWAKELETSAKLGTFLNNIDGRISKAQELIDKAKTNGKDVSGLQKALDNFSEAVSQARTLYQNANGIITAHAGFDTNGKVVDRIQAFSTVQELRDKFKEIRQVLVGPGKALRDAIKTFREANKPIATPTTS
jgi:hypothetical protein